MIRLLLQRWALAVAIFMFALFGVWGTAERIRESSQELGCAYEDAPRSHARPLVLWVAAGQ